jgi:hypothetical protein
MATPFQAADCHASPQLDQKLLDLTPAAHSIIGIAVHSPDGPFRSAHPCGRLRPIGLQSLLAGAEKFHQLRSRFAQRLDVQKTNLSYTDSLPRKVRFQ